MLVFHLHPLGDPRCKEVVLRTTGGEEIVVVLCEKSGRGKGWSVGFLAPPEVKITRRPTLFEVTQEVTA